MKCFSRNGLSNDTRINGCRLSQNGYLYRKCLRLWKTYSFFFFFFENRRWLVGFSLVLLLTAEFPIHISCCARNSRSKRQMWFHSCCDGGSDGGSEYVCSVHVGEYLFFFLSEIPDGILNDDDTQRIGNWEIERSINFLGFYHWNVSRNTTILCAVRHRRQWQLRHY